MKRLILSSLSTMLLTGTVAPVALAQTDPNTLNDIRIFNYEDLRMTEAFNLVSLAYRGQLEDEGIEGYGILIQNYRTGYVTVEDLIRAGVEEGYLTEATLSDEDYVNAVDTQLNALTF